MLNNTRWAKPVNSIYVATSCIDLICAGGKGRQIDEIHNAVRSFLKTFRAVKIVCLDVVGNSVNDENLKTCRA
jgi:hypothetical protein